MLTKHRKEYALYDRTEGYGVVDYYDTLEEVKEAAEEWELDTDGDCDLVIRKWNDDVQAYISIREEDAL